MASCSCFPGYFGLACEECDGAAYCNGHGKCFDPLLTRAYGKESVICHCDSTYTGKYCDISKCPSASGIECSGHGHCVEDGKSSEFQCKCHEGWTNRLCSFLECPSDVKGENGRCKYDEESKSFVWVCNEGFEGDKCAPVAGSGSKCEDASGGVCSGNGICVGGACYCSDGWMPPHCDVALCSMDCGAHGSCIGGKCVCDDDHQGDRCEMLKGEEYDMETCRETIKVRDDASL